MIEFPIVIRTGYSKREAVERLRDGIAGTGVLTGRVSERQVTVWRGVARMWPRPVPVFRGRFVSDGGQLALRGRFSIAWQDRLAMLAAVFFIAWYVVARGPITAIAPSLIGAFVFDVVVPHVLHADKRREIRNTLELLLTDSEEGAT